MKKFTKSLLFIALAIIPMTFFGQETPASNNYFIGIEGGATQMFADNEKFVMDQTKWDAGLFGGITVKNALSVYAGLGYATLKAKNGDFFQIDECNLIQANVNFGYNILQLFGFNPERRWSIMPHVGLGGIMHRTKTTFSNGTVIENGYIKDGAVEGHGFGGRKLVYTNNFGLKFSYTIKKKFEIGLDFVSVKTDTEALDNYIHGRHSDWYGYANLALAYKFGYKEIPGCPACPEAEEYDCNVCKDAIEQAAREAAKEAVEEAMKDYQPAPAAATEENNGEGEGESEAQAEEENPDSPEAMAKNWDEKDIHLSFKVGKAEVKDTQANKDEVKKISDDMEEGREISKIKTMGYASPEGNDDWNQKLSEDRAKATAEYIEKNLGDQAEGIEFESKGMGSDWDGFYKALEASDIAAKDEIRDEIKNSEDPAATLNQMIVKYPELEKVLNTLRVTRIYINK